MSSQNGSKSGKKWSNRGIVVDFDKKCASKSDPFSSIFHDFMKISKNTTFRPFLVP